MLKTPIKYAVKNTPAKNIIIYKSLSSSAFGRKSPNPNLPRAVNV